MTELSLSPLWALSTHLTSYNRAKYTVTSPQETNRVATTFLHVKHYTVKLFFWPYYCPKKGLKFRGRHAKISLCYLCIHDLKYLGYR